MHWISKESLEQETLFGTFLNLGSSLSAELAASKGFDWLLVDTEHGSGDFGDMVSQLQAMSGWPVSPLVRVLWNDAQLIKRTLDAGAAGIMVPYVNNAAEAAQAVAAMRYPPAGIRGTAGTTRATAYGTDVSEYQQTACDAITTIVQLESPEAIDRAEEIASVPGVDVLFVGPLDLSFNLQTPRDFNSPKFCAAMQRVTKACESHSAVPGILATIDSAERFAGEGFTFIGIGSDGYCLNTGLSNLATEAQRLKRGGN